MATSNSFDVIVLGAGAMGSAAAYHLAQRGKRVLLLEQFAIGHDRGSSHGSSRIIRYSYNHPAYIALSKAAFPMWFALEQEAGEKLYTRTGGLDFGPPDEESLIDTGIAMTASGIEYETLSSAEASKRFPQFRFPDDWLILYQEETGMMAATRCVLAHVRLAKQHGAAVIDNSPVVNLTIRPDSVEVHTRTDSYTAAKLVIATGAWAGAMFETLDLNLPLMPLRTQPVFFQPENSADYQPGRFPCYIAHTFSQYAHMGYGLPDADGIGVKIATHGGRAVNDPSQINYTPYDEEVEMARAFARKHIPGAADAPVGDTHACIYTMTPDEHFIIDLHPAYSHVVVSSACSGHGFKFSTLIGSILADLAIDGHTEHDISLFSATRFGDSHERDMPPLVAVY